MCFFKLLQTKILYKRQKRRAAVRSTYLREAQKINPCGLRATPALDTVCCLRALWCAATENTKNTMNTGFYLVRRKKQSERGVCRHSQDPTPVFPVFPVFPVGQSSTQETAESGLFAKLNLCCLRATPALDTVCGLRRTVRRGRRYCDY